MERALQFLRNHKDVALATSEDNIPKLRIFQVMKQEGNWRELRKNPNVELIAYEGNISVRCSGMVNFNVEDDTKRWIYEHNAVLQRLYSNYDQMVYFCLPIAEMDYYDLQPTPPEFLHFDLMAGEVSHGLANSTDMIDGFTKTNKQHKQLARE